MSTLRFRRLGGVCGAGLSWRAAMSANVASALLNRFFEPRRVSTAEMALLPRLGIALRRLVAPGDPDPRVQSEDPHSGRYERTSIVKDTARPSVHRPLEAPARATGREGCPSRLSESCRFREIPTWDRRMAAGSTPILIQSSAPRPSCSATRWGSPGQRAGMASREWEEERRWPVESSPPTSRGAR